jgi:hypothetical protein
MVSGRRRGINHADQHGRSRRTSGYRFEDLPWPYGMALIPPRRYVCSAPRRAGLNPSASLYLAAIYLPMNPGTSYSIKYLVSATRRGIVHRILAPTPKHATVKDVPRCGAHEPPANTNHPLQRPILAHSRLARAHTCCHRWELDFRGNTRFRRPWTFSVSSAYQNISAFGRRADQWVDF